ncbi:MAG: zinc-ribbon domain-containing protein [Coriobacteriales bacterium]|jgi:tetratricopeptide (TPR) repeat protein|nr:zinc-ribbon domain-containing protein [Coriobacteriales bacterium]
MFCSKCGTKIVDDGKFCLQCGAPIIPLNSVTPNGQVEQIDQMTPTEPDAQQIASMPQVSSVEQVTPTPQVSPVEQVTPIPQASPIEQSTPMPQAVPDAQILSAPQAWPTQPDAPAPHVYPTPPDAPTPLASPTLQTVPTELDVPKKKRSKLPFIIVGAVIFVIAIVIAGVVISDMLARQAAAEALANRYEAAIVQMNDGYYDDALSEFEDIGPDYKNTAEYIKECEANIDFENAIALYESGDYEAAASAFMLLPDTFETTDLILDCYDNLDYADAVALLEADSREEAYTAFKILGDFKDSAEMAQSCLVPMPATSVLYQHGSYHSSVVSMKFDGSGSSQPSFIKIYSGDTHVASIFVNKGESITMDIAPGTYTFKEAWGDLWFGDKEMFGKKGSYSVMTFNEGYETVDLESYYDYTISLYTSAGGNVGSRKEDMGSF